MDSLVLPPADLKLEMDLQVLSSVALRLCGWLRNKFMIVAEALQELDTNRVESWNVSSIVF